ncbi:nuclease-related domain-containing protein [Metamycoplasma neophronis]|nr:nuclease-related domain-containing protein [Metamycoplasma neophronis]
MSKNKKENIFRKIINGIKRWFAPPLLLKESKKYYGDGMESRVSKELKMYLPDAKVYHNICLNVQQAKGEIDFLIIYKSNVYVIEVKSWKGNLKQDGNTFIQDKNNGKKIIHKSPFKQVIGNLMQLKEQNKGVWFEPIVLFLDADTVVAENSVPWFTDIESMCYYILKNIHNSNHHIDLEKLEQLLIGYDILYTSQFLTSRWESCIIDPSSLVFEYKNMIINKNNINKIDIVHSLLSDKLTILLNNLEVIKIKVYGHEINYQINGEWYKTNISKLNNIFINAK